MTPTLESDVVASPSAPAGDTAGSVPQQSFRKVRGITPEERVEYGVALAAAAHLVVILRLLLDWDDLVGSSLIGLITFVLVHFLIVRQRASAEIAVDRAVTTVMWTVGTMVVAVLVWMVTFVAVKGAKRLRWSFITDDLGSVGPLDPGGGAYHAIVGTAEQVGIAALIVIPISVMTAVYLHEVRGRMASVVRFVVDALAGLPSIVAGLVVITIFRQYSGLNASIALVILAIPIVTRGSEEVLRTVPDSLREASLALGAPQWRVVLRVVLPTAQSGLVTIGLLAVARMVGETAPVLLTAGGSQSLNYSPIDGQQGSLSLFIYQLIRSPDATTIERAWAGALLLLMIVIVVFVAARIALARSERKLGRR